MYNRRDAIEGFHPVRSTAYFQHAKQQRQNEAFLAHLGGGVSVTAGALLAKPALLEYWPYAAQVERLHAGTPCGVSKMPARHLVSFPDGRLRSFLAGGGDPRRRFVGAREPDESDEWVAADGDDDSGMAQVENLDQLNRRSLMSPNWNTACFGSDADLAMPPAVAPAPLRAAKPILPTTAAPAAAPDEIEDVA